MGEGHSHGAAIPSAAGRHQKPLYAALALTLSYMAAEIIGGIVTGSLALIADAAHMATDAGGLALALFAIHFAQKNATPQKTYGYLRTEILAALTNAVVLLLLTIYILYEAYKRFQSPPEILSGPMLAVAAVGLVVNLISMKLLSAGSSESLNVQGAYFEVLSDMLGSLGVIAAALIIMYTGWTLADPIIGARHRLVHRPPHMEPPEASRPCFDGGGAGRDRCWPARKGAVGNPRRYSSA